MKRRTFVSLAVLVSSTFALGDLAFAADKTLTVGEAILPDNLHVGDTSIDDK